MWNYTFPAFLRLLKGHVPKYTLLIIQRLYDLKKIKPSPSNSANRVSIINSFIWFRAISTCSNIEINLFPLKFCLLLGKIIKNYFPKITLFAAGKQSCHFILCLSRMDNLHTTCLLPHFLIRLLGEDATSYVTFWKPQIVFLFFV